MTRPFVGIGVVLIVLIVTAGCGAPANKTAAAKDRSNGSNNVLDVAPTPAAPAAKPAYTATAYKPADAPPSDSITYTTAPGTYAAVEPAVKASAAIAPTATPAAPATGGGKYKVKPGDTLFGIARTTYGDGKQWNRIATANPGLSPQSLKAGQTITIP